MQLKRFVTDFEYTQAEPELPVIEKKRIKRWRLSEPAAGLSAAY
jgi:hypothetical protein